MGAYSDRHILLLKISNVSGCDEGGAEIEEERRWTPTRALQGTRPYHWVKEQPAKYNYRCGTHPPYAGDKTNDKAFFRRIILIALLTYSYR